MAKARKKRARVETEERHGPTPEQFAQGQFRKPLITHIRVPVIDTLAERGDLTNAEHAALNYYRDQAGLADRSPLKSNLDRSVGAGHGPGVSIISAAIETGRIERDLGSLREIARAVAVDDVSLTQWCIAKHGGRERYNGSGKVVAIVPVSERRHMRTALLELKFAAGRVTK